MIKKMGGKQSNKSIPVLIKEGKYIMTNEEKAEELIEVFVKVHSNNNILTIMRVQRDQIMKENPNVLRQKAPTGGTLDADFTMYELKQVIPCLKSTSPDVICYEMIKHLSDTSLISILKLFNKIWEVGKLPMSWKHGVIIPIGKHSKDHTVAANFRPVALTSNLCKVMAKLIVSRLNYVLESRNLLSYYQSDFRKARNTMDPVICSESEIKKAIANKEVLVRVFFDVEKAYDMLWKEGVLIKLDNMGIKGKMYNCIIDFLFNRTIQVRVGTSYSSIYSVDNGTHRVVCAVQCYLIL